jgi:hypothetical protein
VTAVQRVRRIRAALLTAIAGAAVLWGALAGLAVVALFAGAELAAPLPLPLRRAAVPLAIVASALGGAVVIWRGRYAVSLGRVALYVEERIPTLQFALATAVDLAGTLPAVALEHVVQDIDPRGVLRAPVRRALGMPAAMLLAAVVAWRALPPANRARVLSPRSGDLLSAPYRRSPLANRLVRIVARVEPPSYARQPLVSLDDPSDIQALVGSRVTVSGMGAAASHAGPLAALVGRDSLTVRAAGDTWSVSLSIPTSATVIKLLDRGYDRLLTLEPHADNAPAVTLSEPARDSTYPLPKGSVAFAASAADDIGLGRVEFEFRHSSGGGELFHTRQWTAGGLSLHGDGAATIRVTVRLDTMKLGPGDVLHVRAIAVDLNDVTGPDTGVSDTRTLRIDDPRSRDTLRINPSRAVPLDTTLLSQRMLIIQAESLLARRIALAQLAFGNEARRLGFRQGQLRSRVEELISTPESEDRTTDLEEQKKQGQIAEEDVASLLRQASNAMVDAERLLVATNVSGGIPHMRRALHFLDRARQSRRLYLRGVVPAEPIDLNKVRLTGEDKASPAPRGSRQPEADARRALLARIDRVAPLLSVARQTAADSLTFIRVDALKVAPDAAVPLRQAIDALRRGESAVPPLQAARRRLQRSVDTAPSLSPWQRLP